jgi:hypothetical protein
MGPQRLTIDLDGAWCYRAIHGVVDVADTAADADVADDAAAPDPVLLQGLPRFLDLCARLSVTATLFVVGRDLREPRYAALVAAASAAGHAVESHSFSHAYDLSRWPRAAVAADVRASADAIATVTGRRPVGFRAPGYNLSAALLDGVKEAGISWSSSLLPSPLYFAARLAIIAKTAARQRRSASLVGHMAAFVQRRRQHANGLREFPLSAPRGVPFTGTMLAVLGDRAARALVSSACASEDVTLELHAADFVAGSLLPVGQPDAAVRLSDKLTRIEQAARRVVQVAPRATDAR